MAINYTELPVYAQKEVILSALKENQVIVVQSPTGSGKTTQIPVILHEAGYDATGIIGVTQPRRIAALSVSEFISKQLGTTYPGLVGYKMRFEDKTDITTKIKIMTDGILLQEMKLDSYLSKYSVLMVDEAHERSLNIDFVLGLLKRVLHSRSDFKVIVSSATMNAERFSEYFNNCPIVNIETTTFPVTMIYDPPKIQASTLTETASDALLLKISETVERILQNNEDDGGILIFLPGEKIIKDCMKMLDHSYFSSKIHTLPLYGRLSKEDQERVFKEAPKGKKKVVISTNIAETSVTIADITAVIDTGLAKLNFYSPRTFTSSLVETQVSKASCQQRRGRAGRTKPGTCYRLYSRKDFETRAMYTLEEIYRTDLSEVILQMADLGITDFMGFDFISHPGKEGIIGAIDTLTMLGALENNNSLSSIGKMMTNFPLEPRVSRIIVEAIMKYPNVLQEVLIAASFLSTHSPYILPPGEEMQARHAHKTFTDIQGDFVAYLNLFYAFDKCSTSEKKSEFCKKYFLDEKIMLEIKNITSQLEDIVNKMGVPISFGGDKADYLACIGCGMIQFVCIRNSNNNYKSLTQDKICIHPGSVMFKQNPLYIVAGEIVRTSRMFAMSVSPLTHSVLNKIKPNLLELLQNSKISKHGKMEKYSESYEANYQKNQESSNSKKEKKDTKNKENDETLIRISDSIFEIKKIKGTKTVILPFEQFARAVEKPIEEKIIRKLSNFKSRVIFTNGFMLLDGEKLSTSIKLMQTINLNPIKEDEWQRKLNININDTNANQMITDAIATVLKVVIAKKKSREYGFVCIFTDNGENFWLKVSRGLSTAVNESLATLSMLSQREDFFTDEQQTIINKVYRMLNELI